MMRKASCAIWVLQWNFSQQKFQFDMHVCRTRKLLSFWASSRSLKGFHWDGSFVFFQIDIGGDMRRQKVLALYKRKARMANVWILVVHQFYEKMFGSKMEGGSMWVVPRHLESLLHMFIGKPFIFGRSFKFKNTLRITWWMVEGDQGVRHDTEPWNSPNQCLLPSPWPHRDDKNPTNFFFLTLFLTTTVLHLHHFCCTHPCQTKSLVKP